MTNKFNSEAEMSKQITKIIDEKIRNMNLEVLCKLEVSAPGCIPDMILVEEKFDSIYYLIAIEFKLTNWRRAIYQAFRYRNFDNESYVILDRKRADAAIKNLKEFERVNIGLITVERSGEMISWFLPEPGLPFSKEYSFDVACSLMAPRKPVNDDMLFTTNLNDGLSMSKLKSLWM